MTGRVVALVLAACCAAPAQAGTNEEETAVIEARALDVPFIDTRAVGTAPRGPGGLAATSGRTVGALADGVCAASAGRLPDSIRIDDALRPRVRVMLERSSTFREQCRRLADAPWVHVAVKLGPYFMDRQGFRAYSTIQRPQPQLLIAVVMLQASADPALWVGHEFEHLVEQLDAVDVRRQAEKRRDAWHTRHGMVETGRAVRAGMRIFDEVRAAERQDNLVE